MKGFNTKLVSRITLLALFVVQAYTVNAEDIDAEFQKAYRQELIQEISNNIESLNLDKQQLDIEVEQQEQNSEKKVVSYISIIGLIISDAFGQAEIDFQKHAYDEVGKINL